MKIKLVLSHKIRVRKFYDGLSFFFHYYPTVIFQNGSFFQNFSFGVCPVLLIPRHQEAWPMQP